MLARPDLHLNTLGFGDVRFSLYFTAFFVRLVLEFTIIHDFGNGRLGYGRDLDKVESHVLGLLEGFRQGKDPDILSFGADNADFLRAYLVIYAYFLLRQNSKLGKKTIAGKPIRSNRTQKGPALLLRGHKVLEQHEIRIDFRMRNTLCFARI